MSTHPSNCRQSNSKAQAVLGAKVPQHLKVLLATEQCLAGGMVSLPCGRQMTRYEPKLGVMQVYEHAIPAALAPASPLLPHTRAGLHNWPGPGRPGPHVFPRRDLQRPAPAQRMAPSLLFLHLHPMPPLAQGHWPCLLLTSSTGASLPCAEFPDCCCLTAAPIGPGGTLSSDWKSCWVILYIMCHASVGMI